MVRLVFGAGTSLLAASTVEHFHASARSLGTVGSSLAVVWEQTHVCLHLLWTPSVLYIRNTRSLNWASRSKYKSQSFRHSLKFELFIPAFQVLLYLYNFSSHNFKHTPFILVELGYFTRPQVSHFSPIFMSFLIYQ